MIVGLKELEDAVHKGVRKLGYAGNDARIIADVLMYAQMRVNNQGITKIATGGVPNAGELEPFQLVKQSKCGALFSGGHSMVATYMAAEKAVELAAEHGVGIAGSNHTHTSSGAIGYFARNIAEAGFIGFVSVGNGGFAAVAPTGSSEPKLGTNPFAYAFPYEGGEVVFDTATAAIAYFGIMEALLTGSPLPENVAVNAKGEPTTDAKEVVGNGEGESVGGALKPFAGYKGYGLSLFVQLMGSAFTLAGIPGANEEDGGGTFVLAIDPGLLAGKDEYMKRATQLVLSMHNAKPIPGVKVTVPGERGDAMAREVEQTGRIEIADAIWAELMTFVGE
jgi:L-2-hydroxycarboxylate dehydrogenase (NAD+)